MTERKWKPGDVALRCDIPTNSVERIHFRASSGWIDADGDRRGVTDAAMQHPTARPLVVIDPEDDNTLSQLWRLLPDNLVSIDQLQHALREFADPKPVIEEPTALYAVVKDRNGNKWCRVGEGVWRSLSSPGPYVVEKHWHDRDAPLNGNVAEILSEGQP